jgi:ABC-type amino acid transport substrate-binding protein
MKIRLGSILVALFLFLAGTGVSFGENYKIGVLAKNGPVKALGMWKTTGEYLSKAVPEHTFEVVPLGFDDVNPAIEAGKVDFFPGQLIHVRYRESEVWRHGHRHHGQLASGTALEILWRCDSDHCRK